MKIFIMALSLVFSVGVHAATWPTVSPGPMAFSFPLGPWDRKDSPPGSNHYLLEDHVAGYGHTLYDRIIFLCQSRTNTSFGACAIDEAPSVQNGSTTISLQFTEKRSLVKHNLNIIGWKRPRFPDGYLCPENQNTLNSAVYTCVSSSTRVQARGVTLTMYIPATEVSKLPFGGIWEASLVLTLKRYATNTIYGQYTMNITIDLTDKGNIQVWVPGFHSDPRVDLNLRPEGNGRYTGTNSLDMCFYDGYSTNSNSMEIKFQDDSASYSGNLYYLHKTDDTTKKLPYSVSLLLGGRRFEPENGISFTINDSAVLATNWNRITAVSMPEINVPVLCWPAQLLFNADVNNPTAGQYSGRIRITFTPSSESL